MSNRNELAEKLELIGRMFEIDGMNDLVMKFDGKKDEKGKKIPPNPVQVNAYVIQIESLLMKNDPELATMIIGMSCGKAPEEIEKMDDGEYARRLKNAIMTDVIGFFGSSPSSAGQR